MKLLVPVSGSNASLAAVRHAAKALRQGTGEVILVNVQPRLTSHAARFTARGARESLRHDRSERALAGARALLDAAGVRYTAVAETGRIAETVARLAREHGVDQVVLGTERRAGWWQALFSPVSRILDLAEVPVAVIGDGRSGAFERYGVPACVGLGLTLVAAAD